MTVLEAIARRCDRWRRDYDLSKNDTHEYLRLIAGQVKVASFAEQPATARMCLERIATFAVLALEQEAAG